MKKGPGAPEIGRAGTLTPHTPVAPLITGQPAVVEETHPAAERGNKQGM